MADGTRTPLAAMTGRVTRFTAQAAAPTSPASQDTEEYLTRDMLPGHLSRFANYITAAWQDRRATNDHQSITQHSTTTDIGNKLVYIYNYHIEHSKAHEMLRRVFCEDYEHWTVETWSRARLPVAVYAKNCATF
ncbi:hypothetical protein E4U48_007783 [Claviceps purpurea]|nr:hypothetical protein E4U25_002851 [Claviceps purpurea]KAG6261473.1 hypothetical protein E4U48_007783 [Claviceps purpurea]KAG6306577.1 hypothetical protein E4U44_007963 [Claviceps purpurea]